MSDTTKQIKKLQAEKETWHQLATRNEGLVKELLQEITVILKEHKATGSIEDSYFTKWILNKGLEEAKYCNEARRAYLVGRMLNDLQDSEHYKLLRQAVFGEALTDSYPKIKEWD